MTGDTPLEALGGGTEAEAIAALAAQPFVHDVPTTEGPVTTYVYPPDWSVTVFDHEAYGQAPRRARGLVIARDAVGFVAALTQHGDGTAVLYSDDAARALLAVLNDDRGGTPGWRDHRIGLGLRETPEWQHWTRADGKLRTQAEFAEHIEDGLREIVAPAPADMLELAQTFEATTAAKFKGGQRLASGQRQLTYEEDISAAAGPGGSIAVPDTFQLLIAPYYGAEPVILTARLRFRLRQGELTLGYKLDRPDDAALKAYQTVVDVIVEETQLLLIRGVPAMPAADA